VLELLGQVLCVNPVKTQEETYYLLTNPVKYTVDTGATTTQKVGKKLTTNSKLEVLLYKEVLCSNV